MNLIFCFYINDHLKRIDLPKETPFLKVKKNQTQKLNFMIQDEVEKIL